MTSGTPSCTIRSSVPQDTFLRVTVVWIAPRQGRIVELVRISKAFVGHQLEIFASERVALSGGEVPERQQVGAANPGVQVVDLGGKSVGRQSLDRCNGFQKRPADFSRRRRNHAVQPDGAGWHNCGSFRYGQLSDKSGYPNPTRKNQTNDLFIDNPPLQ